MKLIAHAASSNYIDIQLIGIGAVDTASEDMMAVKSVQF